MELTVLGSGTMRSLPERNPPGYLLSSQDKHLLLDVGPGVIRQLCVLSSDLLSINLILITHFHLDHCSDLLALLMARYLMQADINRSLTIIGPVGLKNWFESQAQWQGKWLHNALPTLVEWQADSITVDGWEIQASNTLHTQNSLAYRIERAGKSLFFSGDTDWQESLVPLAFKSDVALMECSLPDHLKQRGHLTPKETGTLARQAQVKHLLVTHIYPENDTVDLKERVAAYFDGRITVAKDLMKVDF